ncbi:hypothetical protein ACFL0V_03555 [Nanoarchaeota archaeon]
MKWLKKIFKKEPEPEPEPEDISIELKKLNSWIDSRLTKSFKKILPDIQTNINELETLQTQLTNDLESLNQADLRNPNITDRERQLMEGNRLSYTQQHEIFMRNTEFPELDFKKVSAFCNLFEQLLLRLAKSTGKSHLIMNEFFRDNALKTNKTIKQMSQINSTIKETMQDYDIDPEQTALLSRSVTELESKVKHKKELTTNLEIQKKKLANSQSMKEKINSNIEHLKKGDSYSEFQKLEEKRDKDWETVKATESEVSQVFSPINRPMKKFERIAFDNAGLIKKYVDDAMSALAEDEQMKISSILSSLKSSIQDDKLKVKDKDKALAKIGLISVDSLRQSRDKYLEAKHSIKDIGDRMKNIRALQELNDLNYKMDHVDNQIQLLEEKIEKNTKLLEKIDIMTLKVDVEKSLSQTFNYNIEILLNHDETVPK